MARGRLLDIGCHARCQRLSAAAEVTGIQAAARVMSYNMMVVGTAQRTGWHRCIAYTGCVPAGSACIRAHEHTWRGVALFTITVKCSSIPLFGTLHCTPTSFKTSRVATEHITRKKNQNKKIITNLRICPRKHQGRANTRAELHI